MAALVLLVKFLVEYLKTNKLLLSFTCFVLDSKIILKPWRNWKRPIDLVECNAARPI